MSGVRLDGNADTPKRLNELARHEMILRVLNDIRFDLMVCEIEGWDKREYIRMLQAEINRIGEI